MRLSKEVEEIIRYNQKHVLQPDRTIIILLNEIDALRNDLRVLSESVKLRANIVDPETIEFQRRSTKKESS